MKLLFFLLISIQSFAQIPSVSVIKNPVNLIQGNSINITAVSTTTVTISWTNGNGHSRLCIMKAGFVDSDPVDGTSYTANTTFGSGTQIGTGNYVVFNGIGTSVSVAGLTANTKYSFRIYEYVGGTGAQDYLTIRATNNPFTDYTFTTQYDAVLSRATTQSFTHPVLIDQIFDNNMARRFVRDGVLASADALWWIANSTQNFTRINWVTPSANEITYVNSPTFTADEGINGNGTTSYANLNYVPSSGTLYTQNNASFGYLVTNEIADDGFDIGAVATGPLRISGRSRSAANQWFININDNTNHTSAFTSLSFGLHQVIRTSSTNNQGWQSLKAILPSTGGATSVARPGINVYLGARHNTTAGDVADAFSGRRYGFVYFGNLTMPENRLYYSVISRYRKLEPIFPILPKTGITEIDVFGDSFTEGSGKWLDQLITVEFAAITPTNFAISGKGAWVTVNEICQLNSVGTGSSGHMRIEMTGQNDIYHAAGSGPKTLNKLEAMVRVLFVNHFASGFSAAGASSGLVRTGAYNAGAASQYNARAVGGRHSSAAIPGITAIQNDPSTNGGIGTVTYTFTGTSIAFQLISDSGVADFGTADIELDGRKQFTFDANIYYDNVTDGVNSCQTGPVAFWFTGLTNTTHTLTVRSNGDGLVPVDFFAPLVDPVGQVPLIFTELPYRNIYPALVTYADWDAGSRKKLAAVQLCYDSGFPVSWYSLNTYYDRTDINADRIHPLDGGDKQIASGMSYLFD